MKIMSKSSEVETINGGATAIAENGINKQVINDCKASFEKL